MSFATWWYAPTTCKGEGVDICLWMLNHTSASLINRVLSLGRQHLVHYVCSRCMWRWWAWWRIAGIEQVERKKRRETNESEKRRLANSLSDNEWATNVGNVQTWSTLQVEREKESERERDGDESEENGKSSIMKNVRNGCRRQCQESNNQLAACICVHVSVCVHMWTVRIWQWQAL